jgi:exodeoxyribonuclease VII large subunit
MAENEQPEKRYSVSLLTNGIKNAIEARYTSILVEGEISGWKIYPSGHAYFTLKDEGAQISAVMFASALARSPAAAKFRDGDKIIVRANATVYPPRGNYQLVVTRAKLAGEGNLMQRFLELKNKLKAEGLFDRQKKPLPFMPRRIGIVTSEAGAVIHDMKDVMTRRFPNVVIRLFPALVQGDEAPSSIIRGIEYFQSNFNPDIIIVARGGGSFEDLFCFNDEALVRAVASSAVPIISAVGHETDHTLCDYAADVRAGTPSIAAEIAVPVKADIVQRIEKCREAMTVALQRKGEFFAQRLDHLSETMAQPLKLFCERATARFNQVAMAMVPAMNLQLERSSARLNQSMAQLDLLSPFGVLKRGYSITTASDGSVVRNAADLVSGDEIKTRVMNGEIVSVVKG